MNLGRFLLCGALAAVAAPAAAGTIDGTCPPHSPEPQLSGISALLDAIPSRPVVPLRVPTEATALAKRDADAARAFPLGAYERAVIETSSKVTVPGSFQNDGTCIFHAMRMVSNYWRSIGHDVISIPIDDRSAMPTGDAIAYARDVLGFDNPRAMGITTSGAAQVASHYDFDVEMSEGANRWDLIAAINAGTPPIVTFYCCENGKPTSTVQKLSDGSVAPMFHAGVVEGIDLHRGLVIIKHGWNRKEPFVVPLREFEASWALSGRDMLVMKPKNLERKKK